MRTLPTSQPWWLFSDYLTLLWLFLTAVGPHFEPDLSFETCLSHFRIRVTQEDLFGPPCLCPATVADVELCHWPWQSLHILPSPPPMSSYPTKNGPHYVPSLYKWEADALKLSFCFKKTPGLVCFFWAVDTCPLLSPGETPAGPGPLSSRLDLLARSQQ